MQFNISIFFIVNQHTLYRIYYFYYLNNIDFKKNGGHKSAPFRLCFVLIIHRCTHALCKDAPFKTLKVGKYVRISSSSIEAWPDSNNH